MKRLVKFIASGVIISIYFIINILIDTKLQETFSMAHVESDGYAFVGLQFVQWVCTWSLPIVLITLIVIWVRDIKGIARKIKR